MHWILLAILTAVFFGAYNIFIKLSSGHINQIVGAVILQAVAALLGGVILLVLKWTDSPMQVSQKGILYAILAGVFVGLAEITSFYVFSKGVPASVGIPVIIGGFRGCRSCTWNTVFKGNPQLVAIDGSGTGCCRNYINIQAMKMVCSSQKFHMMTGIHLSKGF